MGPMLPRHILFGHPTRAAARLSPSGKTIAFLAPAEGSLNIWVAPFADLRKARPITRVRRRGPTQFCWLYTDQQIIYTDDNGGDENWRIHSVRVVDETDCLLTPPSGVRARIEGLSPRFPEHILVGLNDRDPRFHDLYKIDVLTGNRRLVFKNEGFNRFFIDFDLRPRVAAHELVPAISAPTLG